MSPQTSLPQYPACKAIPVACACVGMVAGYMDGFKSLISTRGKRSCAVAIVGIVMARRFARPPKDVMGDSIWADDEALPMLLGSFKAAFPCVALAKMQCCWPRYMCSICYVCVQVAFMVRNSA